MSEDSKVVKSAEKRLPPAAGKGRKPGSLNKTTVAVKDALIAAFDGLGGVPELVAWGSENRTAFYQLWAKLLPQEIKGELEVTNVTPEERAQRVAAILDAARARRAREDGNTAT